MNGICGICIYICIWIWEWIPIITSADSWITVCGINCSFWMNFKCFWVYLRLCRCSITCNFIIIPPRLCMIIFAPSNIPFIISRTITLPYPWCINAAATRAFPTLLCFIIVISLPLRSCSRCTCTGCISNLNFIIQYHILLPPIWCIFVFIFCTKFFL